MNQTHLLLLLRRISAFLYDSLLLLALFFFITGVVILFNNGHAIESSAYKFALIPVAGIFFSWFWKNGGQTLGMRAWRIKLVNNHASSVTWSECLVRFITGTLFFAVTFLYALFDANGRTLHDQLSNTWIEKTKTSKN